MPMKRLLFALALSALVAVPWPTLAVVAPPPAAALVAYGCASSTNDKSVTTPAIDSSGSTLLVWALNAYDSGFTPGEFSDSKGNTWTSLTGHATGNYNTIIRYVNSATPTVGSSHTISYGAAVSRYPAACLFAFSGTVTSPFDVENGSSSASASSLATGSVTPGQDNELVFTVYGGDNDSVTPTINGGFTASGFSASSSGLAASVAVAYLVQTTATAANPTWTKNSGTSAITTGIATFKGTAGGGASFIPAIINAPIRGGGAVRSR
jgi:hypothetical protein